MKSIIIKIAQLIIESQMNNINMNKDGKLIFRLPIINADMGSFVPIIDAVPSKFSFKDIKTNEEIKKISHVLTELDTRIDEISATDLNNYFKRTDKP